MTRASIQASAGINPEDDAQFRRRLLLAADGGAWLFLLWCFKYTSFGGFVGMAVPLTVASTGVLGLHSLWLASVELHDFLVAHAVERGRRAYFVQNAPYSPDDSESIKTTSRMRAARVPSNSAELREKRMNDDELYDLVRRRVDRRNRRWILWGAHFFVYLVYLAAFAAFGMGAAKSLGIFIAVAWMGAIVLHGIVTGMTDSRDHEVEREVARLRRELYEEKPKRLELSDDGEMVEVDSAGLRDDKRRRDSV